MSSLAPTDRRYAVRVGIARYSLFAAGWAFAVAVILAFGSVVSVETWSDPGYAAVTGSALTVLVALVPTFSAIGAAFGLGCCRIACIAIVGVVAAFGGLVIAAA